MRQPNLTNKKVLLFDCDNTLAYTMEAHNQAYKLAFALNNVPWDREEHELHAPYGGDHLMQKMVVDKGFEDKVEDIVADKQRLLGICLTKFMTPNYELVKMIKQKSNDMIIGVVSNGRRKSITQVLNELGIRYHVDAVFCKEDYKNPKPNPEPYVRAMNHLATEPLEVVVFEDNDIGMKAAEAAGINSIVEVDVFNK